MSPSNRSAPGSGLRSYAVRWPYAALAFIFLLLAAVFLYSGAMVASMESYSSWSDPGATTLAVLAAASGLLGVGTIIVGVIRRRSRR